MSDFRNETRRQRYNKKMPDVKIMPVSVATISFSKEANVAYVVRAAVCFGAKDIHIIGSVPKRDIMNDLSGSTYDYISAHFYSRPEHFTQYCKENYIELISFEMPSDHFQSEPINNFRFNFKNNSCIVVGHETMGVPAEILKHSKRVYIPMNGIGYCLNTSQAANIALYEASKQFKSFYNE